MAVEFRSFPDHSCANSKVLQHRSVHIRFRMAHRSIGNQNNTCLFYKSRAMASRFV